MSDYQPPQTKQERIAILLDEINKKTQEVERLTKEETCVIKKEDNNNCSELIVVLTEIVNAEEHYEATQTAVIEANKICQATAKVCADERAVVELAIDVASKAVPEEEMETNKVFYTAVIEAEKNNKEAYDVYIKKKNEYETLRNSLFDEFKKKYPTQPHFNFSGTPETYKLEKEKDTYYNIFQPTNLKLSKATQDRDAAKLNFMNKQQLSFQTMRNELSTTKAYYTNLEAHKALQEAKLKESDARQKYESTLRKLFKPYLIEALANIEWKRANSEMIDVMLNQISVLQTMYQQETKARDVMLNQISVLQTWYQQETKAREEKRITNVWKFRLFYAGLGVGAILLMNYNFNYPFINVSAPTGYLAMY